MRSEDISEGKVQDTTGDIIYRVQFKALVFKPFRGEVLDGEVVEITDNGIMIQSGPLRSFISTMVSPSSSLLTLLRDCRTSTFTTRTTTSSSLRTTPTSRSGLTRTCATR